MRLSDGLIVLRMCRVFYFLGCVAYTILGLLLLLNFFSGVATYTKGLPSILRSKLRRVVPSSKSLAKLDLHMICCNVNYMR